MDPDGPGNKAERAQDFCAPVALWPAGLPPAGRSKCGRAGGPSRVCRIPGRSSGSRVRARALCAARIPRPAVRAGRTKRPGRYELFGCEVPGIPVDAAGRMLLPLRIHRIKVSAREGAGHRLSSVTRGFGATTAASVRASSTTHLKDVLGRSSGGGVGGLPSQAGHLERQLRASFFQSWRRRARNRSPLPCARTPRERSACARRLTRRASCRHRWRSASAWLRRTPSSGSTGRQPVRWLGRTHTLPLSALMHAILSAHTDVSARPRVQLLHVGADMPTRKGERSPIVCARTPSARARLCARAPPNHTDTLPQAHARSREHFPHARIHARAPQTVPSVESVLHRDSSPWAPHHAHRASPSVSPLRTPPAPSPRAQARRPGGARVRAQPPARGRDPVPPEPAPRPGLPLLPRRAAPRRPQAGRVFQDSAVRHYQARERGGQEEKCEGGLRIPFLSGRRRDQRKGRRYSGGQGGGSADSKCRWSGGVGESGKRKKDCSGGVRLEGAQGARP
jgi:hypothetical protein